MAVWHASLERHRWPVLPQDGDRSRSRPARPPDGRWPTRSWRWRPTSPGSGTCLSATTRARREPHRAAPPSSAPYRGASPQEESHDDSTRELDTRQRAYSWEDQEATRLASITQDGLAVLHAIGAGTLPLPPAVRTLGIEPVEAEPGRVTFTLDLGEYHLNPFGIVHGGVLAALLDTAMGCAVHSLLPAAVGYVTGELNVRFLRPAVLTGGPLECTGEVVHRAGARWWPPPASSTRTAGSSPSPAPPVWCGDRDARQSAGGAKGRHLILGGGFGGAHVARLLREATIVSPESSMLYTPLLPEVAAGAVEPRHAFVPLRKMCPDAELLRGRVSALDQPLGRSRSRRRSGRRGVLPASRDRPGLDRPDAAHPGAGRACDDVQGPRRRHPPAQPRHSSARPRRGRSGQREPLPHLRLRRRRLRRGRGARRDAAARRGRRPPLPGTPGRAPAVGPGRRRSRHPRRGASPARGPHDRTAAPPMVSRS